MVFSSGQTVPSSSRPINISTQTQIRSMDVWVGAVRMDEIRILKAPRHMGGMLCKRIDGNNAGDRFNASLSED
jgi:hypothetical protein